MVETAHQRQRWPPPRGPPRFTSTLSDFAIAPKAIAVPVGRELTFHIENTGAAPHSFAIVVGPRTLASPMLDAAGTGELKVPSLEAGTYDALCTASGHTDLGMMATVVAGEEGAATSGGSDPNADPMDMASMTAEQMADMHRASVETFPAETRGTGNEILEPEVVDGVKDFTLWATQIQWEVSPGVVKEAMAYNGQIPGPQLQVQLRRSCPDRPPEPARLTDGASPARYDPAERSGRCALHHPGSRHARQFLRIHVHGQGSSGDVRLHGYHFQVVAQDGFPLREPYMADTLVVAPGQRFDVLVHAVHPGTCALHCHILPHVEGPQGMFGMVTALVVQ